ncbi:MAG: hypothetical protein ABH833_03875, partial [Parcubacteria group bacterium]
MISKIIKQGLLSILSVLMLGIFASNSFAMDYSEREIVLEKTGTELSSYLIHEEKPFNSVAIRLDKVVDGIEVNFGNGWE